MPEYRPQHPHGDHPAQQGRPGALLPDRPATRELVRIVVLVLGGALAALSASLTAAAQTPSQPPGEFALQAVSPKFWDLIDKDARLEKVATGFSFTEGPVW